jgi:hypothetical protein
MINSLPTLKLLGDSRMATRVFNPSWLSSWRVTSPSAQHSPSGAQFRHVIRIEFDTAGNRFVKSSLEVPFNVDSIPPNVLDEAMEIWKNGLLGTVN